MMCLSLNMYETHIKLRSGNFNIRIPEKTFYHYFTATDTVMSMIGDNAEQNSHKFDCYYLIIAVRTNNSIQLRTLLTICVNNVKPV